MQRLTDYEKTAIRMLCKSTLPEQVMENVLNTGTFKYEYTGAGYFITIHDKDLPTERIVCSKPFIGGKDVTTGEIESGFVVFIENNTLTLE